MRGGLWSFSITRPGGAHQFKAIRPDLVELRQEVRGDIVALYSRIDSLDAGSRPASMPSIRPSSAAKTPSPSPNQPPAL